MKIVQIEDLEKLPGADIILKGLHDIADHRFDTREALLTLMAWPRLQRAGLDLPQLSEQTESKNLNIELYGTLAEYGNGAHFKYNALVRRIVSFCNTLDRITNRAGTTKGTKYTAK